MTDVDVLLEKLDVSDWPRWPMLDFGDDDWRVLGEQLFEAIQESPDETFKVLDTVRVALDNTPDPQRRLPCGEMSANLLRRLPRDTPGWRELRDALPTDTGTDWLDPHRPPDPITWPDLD